MRSHRRRDVTAIEDFIETGNVQTLIPADASVVIDAIDAVAAKAALIAWCRSRELPVITCGAAGGRRDPLQLRCEDLARTTGDALLASVRSRLRRDHGFPAAAGAASPALARKFDVAAIFSGEPAAGLTPADSAGGTGGTGGAPLACAGYGSIVTVTASMGLAAASRAIDIILTRSEQPLTVPSPLAVPSLPA